MYARTQESATILGGSDLLLGYTQKNRISLFLLRWEGGDRLAIGYSKRGIPSLGSDASDTGVPETVRIDPLIFT
jgi:hypothetical protein